MKKSQIILLVISLINQALIAVFALVPFKGHQWILPMIIPLFNVIIYGIIFIQFLRSYKYKGYEVYNIPSMLMILFIPLYFYSAINISTSGDHIYYIFAGITAVFITILTILMFALNNKRENINVKTLKKSSIIYLIICVVLCFIAFKLTQYYYSINRDVIKNYRQLFYSSLYIYIGLIIIYLIFIIINIRKLKQ